MDADQINDYLRAVANLYGIISLADFIKLYNDQNTEPITAADLEPFLANEEEPFVHYRDHIVHEAVFVDDSFEQLQTSQRGKPLYVPDKGELLKYADDLYIEETGEAEQLCGWLQEDFGLDPVLAAEVAGDIQLICAVGFSPEEVLDEFNRRNLSFDDLPQVNTMMQLVSALANNTRIWENRGHTPQEIFNTKGRRDLRPQPPGRPDNVVNFPGTGEQHGKDRPSTAFKVGRNDPCPCGSGKKHKHCCLEQ